MLPHLISFWNLQNSDLCRHCRPLCFCPFAYTTSTAAGAAMDAGRSHQHIALRREPPVMRRSGSWSHPNCHLGTGAEAIFVAGQSGHVLYFKLRLIDVDWRTFLFFSFIGLMSQIEPFLDVNPPWFAGQLHAMTNTRFVRLKLEKNLHCCCNRLCECGSRGAMSY